MLSLGHLLKLWWGQCVVAAAAFSAAFLYYVTVNQFLSLKIMLKEKYYFFSIFGLEHKLVTCFLRVSSGNSDQEELISILKAIYEIDYSYMYVCHAL